MDKYGAVYIGIATAQLEAVFGAEFTSLDAGDMLRVRADYMDAAMADSACTPRDYSRRIGIGNLRSYAAALAVQSRRDAERAS